jgi:hypothetical protein
MPRRASFALVVLALLALPLLAACGDTPATLPEGVIVGEGAPVAELRDLPPFTRVSVASGFKVTIGEAAAQEVLVEAQPNLLPEIETVVRDGQLIVTTANPITTQEALNLTLKMTLVESVALSAGATGYVEHTGPGINLDVSGGATMTAIGDTADLRLVASSGSHAKLSELVAQHAQVALSDGATVELTVMTSLTGSAEGGSTIVLTSPPAQQDVELSTGATIQGG